MHIVEYLGEKIPSGNWETKKVCEVIKSGLVELHLLGISRNDNRAFNIHVSVPVKVSIIDFGLSDCANDNERKKEDFESLEHVLG